MVKILRALVCGLLAVGAVIAAAPRAIAAPPTAPWAGTAVGDVAAVDLDLDGGPTFAGARLAHGDARTSSTASPRSTSLSRNLAARVDGLDLPVRTNSQSAPPDNPTTEIGGLAATTADGVSVGRIVSSNSARFPAAPTACLPSGIPYARTSTSTTAMTLDPAGAPDLLAADGGSVTTSTRLASTGGSGVNRQVESQAAGVLGDVSVFDGDVDVEVEGVARLTAVANGTAGGADVSYTAATVTVNGTAVAVGGSRTVELGDTGAVTVTVNAVDETIAASGLTAAADVAVITLTVRVGPVGAPTGTAAIDLLPLAVIVGAPVGGIDCAPQPLVVTAPVDGSTTEDPSPTIEGTGIPGATVTVSIDGEEIDEVTVTGGDTWSLMLSAAPYFLELDDGEHTVTAVQIDAAGNESDADAVTFRVDAQAPPPVITTPADGLSTNDTTPTITGTAEPGAEVIVSIDGCLLDSAAECARAGAPDPVFLRRVDVEADGSWTVGVRGPLTEGDHTVAAAQLQVVGVSERGVNEFTVDTTAPAAPVITEPDDGDVVDEPTPTIEGTAEPGSTVVVLVDGERVGRTLADEGGRWRLTLDEPLSDGQHSLTVFAVDAAGNESGTSGIELGIDPAEEVITPAGPGLADTGGPDPWFTIAGGILLVAGGTVLRLARRRA